MEHLERHHLVGRDDRREADEQWEHPAALVVPADELLVRRPVRGGEHRAVPAGARVIVFEIVTVVECQADGAGSGDKVIGTGEGAVLDPVTADCG